MSEKKIMKMHVGSRLREPKPIGQLEIVEVHPGLYSVEVVLKAEYAENLFEALAKGDVRTGGGFLGKFDLFEAPKPDVS